MSTGTKLEEDSISTDTKSSESNPTENGIRSSTRVRKLGTMKQKEKNVTSSSDHEKPEKGMLKMHVESSNAVVSCPVVEPEEQLLERFQREKMESKEGMKTFHCIEDNQYHIARKSCKEDKGMTCNCVLSREKMAKGEVGCLDDCLNRMLFLECGQRCALGELCANKCFQRHEYVDCKIFKTEKKGFGLRAEKQIPSNTFIMEFVGEVVGQTEFARRVKKYAKDDVKHSYFMALTGEIVIDATCKGNISRFINHSCDPNAETQKWTVNGELRIGFFSLRSIQPGEEITIDYRLQRYGKVAQKCFCEATNCRGWIGENSDVDDDDDDEEDDE